MPEWLLCSSCCSRWRHSSEQENLGWSHSIGIKLCARELGSHMASWDLRPGLVVYTWECMSPGSCCNRDLENKRIVAWPDLITWFFLSPLSSPSLFLFSHALNKTKHIKWQLYGIKENKSSRDKAKQKSLFLFFFFLMGEFASLFPLLFCMLFQGRPILYSLEILRPQRLQYLNNNV